MAPDRRPHSSSRQLRWRAGVALVLAGAMATVLAACGVEPSVSRAVGTTTTEPGQPSVVMDGVIDGDGTTSTLAPDDGEGGAEPPNTEASASDPATICADLQTVGLVRSPLGEPRLPDPAGQAEAIDRLGRVDVPGTVDEDIGTVLDLAGTGDGSGDGDGDGEPEPDDGLGEAPTGVDSPAEVVAAGERVIAWAAGVCELPGPVWGCVVVLPGSDGSRLSPGEAPEAAWGRLHPGVGPPTRISDAPVILAHLDDAGLIRATLTIDPAGTGEPVIWSARCWSPG